MICIRTINMGLSGMSMGKLKAGVKPYDFPTRKSYPEVKILY
jgi:hypothetical protein